MESAIRVLLVDDHAVVRGGLRLLLETQPDLQVVGEADSGQTALERCRALNPDLVLMDIAMRGMNGLEATRAILAERPSARVLILTMHEDEEYFSQALAAGARGYVLKEASPAELLAAIRAVCAGGAFLDPALARRLVTAHRDRAAGGAGEDGLTERENEILRLTAAGKSSREIGRLLYISPRTVERHRATLMAKLGLKNRAELIRYAAERDWKQRSQPNGLRGGRDGPDHPHNP